MKSTNEKLTPPPVTIARKCFFSSGVGGGSSTSRGWGHNYTLEAYIAGPMDPVSGLVINLTDLNEAMKMSVAPLDHKHLTYDIASLNMTEDKLETLAGYLYSRLKEELQKRPMPKGVALTKISLSREDDTWVQVNA